MALCGRSGAGKSTIISRVIEQLTTNDQAMPVAYFYCTYNEVLTHDVRNVLGSWLVQLSRRAEVKGLAGFERYANENKEVPIELLEETTAHVAGKVGPVLLVLDALNESTKTRELPESMPSICEKSKQVRCLISSTLLADIIDRPKYTCRRVSMSSDSIKDDVVSYIKRVVDAHAVLRTVGEESILNAIAPRTQGMFRWASCQMNILSGYPTAKVVRRALDNLPGSLDDIYVVLLQRVTTAWEELVRNALLCLVYSLRPLSLAELVDAIAIEIGDTYIDDSCRIPTHQDIIDHCQGLVVWDEDHDEVTLAHSSVANFLESGSIRSSPVAYFAVARDEAVQSMIQKTLNYVLMDEFRSGPCTPFTLLQRHKKYPLLGYASTMWAVHTFEIAHLHGGIREPEARMISQLFETHRSLPNGGNFALWVQCLLPGTAASVIQKATPLYYAASFGLAPVVAMMFEQGQINVDDPEAPWFIDKPCGRGASSPLIVACYRGHIDVVRILLAHGARPNLIGSDGVSGRTWARVLGHRAIARLMRENGGVERDVSNYMSRIMSIEYSVDEAEDITGDDEVSRVVELPYHGMLKRYYGK